jgi:CPA1 family monovalent cation:H+ antiporter
MTNAGGGIILGLSAGVLGVIIAGRTTDHIVEAAVTAVVAYGAFLSAEQLHVSGVLATVCAGLVMGGIGVSTRDFRFGFSSEGQTFVIELWEFAAFIANSLVFLLIGLTAGRVPFHEVGLAPLAAAIILVLLGRAATVYPLSLLFALSQWRIGFREQHVLWWAGLRGALALALVLALPRSIPQRESIVIATFGVVTFSVMVQGLTMKPLLHWLKFLPSR